MVSASPEAAASDDEARIQRLTDAHCLRHQLMWMTKTAWLVPVDLLWMLLAREAGVAWEWVLPWITVRFVLHLMGPRWARALMHFADTDPRAGLARSRWIFSAFAMWQTLMFPAYFIGSDDQTKLLAMLLAASYHGTVVVSASGQQATYWWAIAPPSLVMATGWTWRGGWLGALIVVMMLLSAPLTAKTIRQQRSVWERLLRLQDRTQTLAKALATERDRAEGASAARTRFFAAASHDLRQPLHALSVNATTLQLLAGRAGDQKLRRVSEGIGRALAQSQSLLDALLDISRLDAGAVRLHRAPCDLGALLASLSHEFEALAAERGLTFVLASIRGPAWADTDTDQLLRILRNLLDNALKFTPSGQLRVSLTAEPDVDAPVRWRIEVADTGIGIAAADQDKVFEEFFQAGNPTRDRARGLGLGLAIVRRTAELIGAEVKLMHSAPGQGSVFAVWLPASRAPAATRVGARPPGPDESRPLQVLVVDDEQEVLLAVAGLLDEIGWQAHVACSGAQALALAGDSTRALDAAVLDYRLPGEDGLALLEGLRALRPRLPAVIVSGDAGAALPAQEQGLRILHKPLDGERLVDALRALTHPIDVAGRIHSPAATVESHRTAG